ncbi:MAG: HAMP domain-containing protein [Chloroflexi bacterium]|nr:HAMP domain-containing protein [Chloroflexota bacterium]
MKPWRQIRLLSASPLRAWLEALALGIGLLLLVWLARNGITPGERQNGLFVALLSAMSWYAIRLRHSGGTWWLRIGIELGAGLVPAVLVGGAVLVSGLYLMPECRETIDESGLLAFTTIIFIAFDKVVLQGQSIPEPTVNLSTDHLPLISTLLISGILAYAIMRGLLHLWQYWARLRRRHLIWTLTHYYMLLVALGMFLFATLITINLVMYYSSEGRPHQVFSMVIGIIPVLIMIGFLTLFLVVIVLPPALTLSYFAARRTTRRLQRLTEGTAQLRQGVYSTQVVVEGEDEVAALETDFNAMAHALERAMHDVQTERDNVAKLLRNRRELVASVSHELRTPVATLRGYLESMQNHWNDQLPGELVGYITVMEAETLRLQRLLDDLFVLSRSEVGELAINCQPTALPPVIQRITSAAAPTLWQAYKIELVVHLPAELPSVLVDDVRLEQVLHNLLRNAIRHTPPGGIVAISASRNGAQVIVQVKDTGDGIAPEHLPHIWERFYHVDTPDRADHGGAGLGLALVKELTEAMGGSVSVTSAPGQGSTFAICLPIV